MPPRRPTRSTRTTAPRRCRDTLGQPQNGASFSDGKIVVTGRAEDAPDANASIAAVEVGIVNSAGQYMSSAGTFTSTTPSFRTAFLNSPGSAGSNYSYTTPVIPAGTYSVHVRARDLRDQLSDNDPVTAGDQPRIATGVTVTSPSNNPPVASFTYSCNQNVCTFDGRSSTDENPTSLTYSWSFGTARDHDQGSGPLPTKTFTAPSPAGQPFQVTLTVRDEWTLTNTSARAERDDRRAPGQRRPGADVHPELHRSHLLGEQPGHGGPERLGPATRLTPSPTRGTGVTARR